MSTDGLAAAEQARMHLDLNRPVEAIRILNHALATSPDEAELLRLLAQAELTATEDRAGAAKALPAAQRAIELEPGHPHAWRVIALCYSRLGSHAEAMKAARTSRNLEPYNWASHTVLANVDAAARQISADTHASVNEAMRLAPSNSQVHFVAGHVAQMENRYREAQEHYANALGIDPNHAGARNNIALISMRRGNAGTAVAGFAGILASDPNSELALRNLRATGFTAMRTVYFVIALAVIVADGFIPFYSTASNNETQIPGIVVAALAVVCVVGYGVWIRRRAGVYFARFVRSVPSTDKLLTAWAAILLLCLVALIVAVFLPLDTAVTVYTCTVFALLASAIVVTFVNASRHRRLKRG